MCKPISPLQPAIRPGPFPIPRVPEDSIPAFTIGDVLRGRVCPTAPIVSPLNHPFHKLDDNKKKHKCELSRFEDRWFSSDDQREEEDETDTLFSSRSFSSDSSGSHRRRRSARRRRRSRSEVNVLPMDSDDKNNNIKGSFAVVKKSSDPSGDFRRSMVEMIVEKEMFGAEELEGLLQCFLSLNSHHHHKVIVEVFTEIWEALFPHWS
ncbi:hypothetical protein CRG98_012855 [Punica granatum]|nr:hypothetical protein CRG98_012855 [Punica granatum]